MAVESADADRDRLSGVFGADYPPRGRCRKRLTVGTADRRARPPVHTKVCQPAAKEALAAKLTLLRAKVRSDESDRSGRVPADYEDRGKTAWAAG